MNIHEIRKARFTRATEIELAIDLKKADIACKREKATDLYRRAAVLHGRWLTRDETQTRRSVLMKAAKMIERGDRLIERAGRMETGRLAALKRKLAEFKTQLLPGFGEDQSIPKL